MTDEELDKMPGDADQAIGAPVAGALDGEAGLAAVRRTSGVGETQREGGRVTARGHLAVAHVTYEGTSHALVAARGPDGSWLVHGPGAVGVRLANDAMISLCEEILHSARGERDS